MTALLLMAFTLSTTPEVEAARLVRERFEVAGRTVPNEDAQLMAAAQRLSALAATRTASDAAGLLAVTEAVSRAGGWDASPTAIVIKAPRHQLLAELARQKDLAAEPSTAMGVGVSENGSRAALCVLLAVRKFELRPLARAFPKPPGRLSVCGALSQPLETAELFVTLPSGGVERQPMAKADDGVCAPFFPSARGRYVVEVLGRGPRGPEVAALFFVDVGASSVSADQQFVEPASAAEARRAVTARINALRRTMGLVPVSPDKVLDAVAQAYADRLAAEGFFSHVDPTGGDLKSRLAAARYRFSAAGENLGSSSGPLAAHFGIEHSPGHRLNLLERDHRALGLGLATRAGDGLTVLVQVLAAPVRDDGADPLEVAYGALAEARAKKGLPALTRHPALEALAVEHARRCLSRDKLSAELEPGKKLHERVFEVVTDAREASVDLAIVESAQAMPSSRNLADLRYSRVGVGLVRGDSPTYGDDKLWVVIVYANRDE
ncbi:MAG: CAP domain-containing protein [Myxococcaceae bacterium]|nr:CAP domain-containing protein [Myxococcaceae bacterium]